MKFTLLGPIEAVHGGRICTPTAPKVQQTLALLLSRANQLVDIDTLIYELWGERPPRSAVTTTQTYIYHLRRSFAAAMDADEVSRLLITQPPGYCLAVDEEQLDVRYFERLAAEGGDLVARGQVPEGSRRIREALALWRGPALANVSAGPVLEAYKVHLQEMRIRAVEEGVQADLRLGRHRELVPELRMLVASHPLNESFHAQLITSLKHCGRRGEALAAYRALQRLLREELGLEPTEPLRNLLLDLLHGREAPALVS